MRQKFKQILAVFLVWTRDKRPRCPISKNNANPRTFKGYRVDLIEMHVPVDAKIRERDTEDSVVRKYDDLFLAGEILLLAL